MMTQHDLDRHGRSIRILNKERDNEAPHHDCLDDAIACVAVHYAADSDNSKVHVKTIPADAASRTAKRAMLDKEVLNPVNGHSGSFSTLQA